MQDMKGTKTAWIELILTHIILLEALYLTEATLQYASIGESIQMTCPFKHVQSWQKLETQDILASCENGTPQINSTILKRISITDSCNNLTIHNFTEIDVGLYRCYVFDQSTSNSHDFNITIRTLTIVEANGSNVIQCREGANITLTCLMNGPRPDTMLFWTTTDMLLASNRSRYVIHSLQSQRVDDMKQFVCFANSSKDRSFIEAKVRLKLILKPRISVISSPSRPTISRGQHIKLLCNDKSGNNEIIDTFLWRHDGKLLANNTNILSFEHADPAIAGEYICTAKNVAGRDSAVIKITVTFFPVVQNDTVVFEKSDGPRLIVCNASGVPDTYAYNVWLHYTYTNRLVRSLDGLANGTLILPHKETERLMYEDCGIYICNVTNNIPDAYGRLWQMGYIKVIVAGRPEIAKPRRHLHIGHLNKSFTINILVLSSSNVSQAIWFNANRRNLENKTCSSSMIETEFHGLAVTVSGYTCDLYIQIIREEDFQNYAVDIYNAYGKTSFETLLISARQPEMPKNVKVIALKFEIIVTWQRGRNDGLHTIFFVEYRERFQLQWDIFPAESKTSVVIDGLQMDSIYFVRLFSKTISGNSNRTDVVIVQTGWHHSAHPSSSWEINVITSAAVVIILVFMCGMKALAQRYCFNTSQNRNNQSQANDSPIRHAAQYDEIDSVYYITASENVVPQLPVNSTTLAIQSSGPNCSRTFDCIATDNFDDRNSNNDITLREINPLIAREDITSTRSSSSDESYLVPCRNSTTLEMIITKEHTAHEREQAYHGEAASVSSSENSQTYTKSEQTYENLTSTREMEPSYESILET